MMSWRARAFITVASMPMWWAATSSMPRRWLTSEPRTKLPPPTTMATCTPWAITALTSSATRRRTCASSPQPPPPSASPLSLSRMRRYFGGSGAGGSGAILLCEALLSDAESGEPADLDVLADPCHRLGNHIPHAAVFIFDERLLEEDDLTEPLLQPPLDGRRRPAGQLFGDPRSLLLEGAGRDLLPAHVP